MFNSVNDALIVFSNERLIDTEAWRQAYIYLLRNGGPELQAMFDKAAQEAFGELLGKVKPDGYDQAGAAYYNAESLAEVLGLPLDRVIADIEEFNAAMGEVIQDDIEITRVQ